MDESLQRTLAKTLSVCPVCLNRVDASIVAFGDEVFLEKSCGDHLQSRVPIWRGSPGYAEWVRPKEPVRPTVCSNDAKHGCPYDCGLCAEHRQNPCSVLLEVTQRCDLGCPVCYASSETGAGEEDPSLGTVEGWYDRVLSAAGRCNVQLSGGEPTMRGDLPEIISIGRRKGFSFLQLNTNGLRLARDPGYARLLAEAGLATVFLQFDGTTDDICSALRGRPLVREKAAAVERCGEAGLGVVLVPTLVPGVNTGNVGEILRFALARVPVVRGVHFQPVSYFGRHALPSSRRERFTLPEVIGAIEAQTGGLFRAGDFVPPGCENARCSFHGSFIVLPDGHVRRTAPVSGCGCGDGGGSLRAIRSTALRWGAAPGGGPGKPLSRDTGILDLDAFLEQALNHGFTVSCMAFQDVWNLDLERLRDCCILVLSPDGRLVPFCAYNATSAGGETLYRKGALRG